MKCGCCIPLTCAHFIGYSGVLVILAGILVVLLEPTLVDSILHDSLELVPGSAVYEDWVDPSIPVYLDVYIWHIENAEEFTRQSSGGIRDTTEWTFPRPYAVEVGPFRYREYILKDNIVHYDEHGDVTENVDDMNTITSRSTYSYEQVYDPAVPDTGLDPTQLVSISNLLTLSIPFMVEYLVPDDDKAAKAAVRTLINKVLDDSGTLPVITGVTAHEALFDYHDPVLAQIKEACMNNDACKDTTIAEIPDNFGMLVQKATPMGWHFLKQDTGKKDISDYGKILGFGNDGENYVTRLDWWRNDGPCNDINGTDGTTAPPGLTEEDPFQMFVADIYRSMSLTKTSDQVSAAGTPVREYEVEKFVFERPDINPDNVCYCIPEYWDHYDTGMDCETELEGGLVSYISSSGIPILLSMPHFMWAPKFGSLLDGEFNPNMEDHRTYIQIEPMTGTLVAAAKRIQQSLFIAKDSHYDIFNNMVEKSIVMPLVWVNETFILPQSLDEELYFGSVTAMNLILGIWISLIAVGCIMVLTSVLLVKNGKCGAAKN